MTLTEDPAPESFEEFFDLYQLVASHAVKLDYDFLFRFPKPSQSVMDKLHVFVYKTAWAMIVFSDPVGG